MMANSAELDRVNAILDRIDILYGLEGINPIMVDLLNQITYDVEWMCDRLGLAWSTIHAYQEELRHLYNEGK